MSLRLRKRKWATLFPLPLFSPGTFIYPFLFKFLAFPSQNCLYPWAVPVINILFHPAQTFLATSQLASFPLPITRFSLIIQHLDATNINMSNQFECWTLLTTSSISLALNIVLISQSITLSTYKSAKDISRLNCYPI